MSDTKINFGNLDADTFHEMISKDPDAILIDVRTPFENNQARIPNSVLIDINNPSFPEEIDKLDKSKNYFLYCRSGSRSYYACAYMKKIGFNNVYNLKPGIIGWKGEIEPE
ncbi:MAG TPA: rhodanese-like domain-containing protein [Ignavibacteriaceae bacterium]